MNEKDKETLCRAQSLISALEIANSKSPDEIYMLQLEANAVLPRIHELRERLIKESIERIK